MDVEALADAVQELRDREAIRDCMARYCRGVDRLDAEAIRSAYWSDIIDEHGPYNLSREKFIEAAQQLYTPTDHVVHMVANMEIHMNAPHAFVQSSWQALQALEEDDEGRRVETFLCGRYLDHFEKRDEEWRIARRRVVYDWIRKMPLEHGLGDDYFATRTPTGRFKPDDALYSFVEELPFSVAL